MAVDQRFFAPIGTLTLDDIVRLTGSSAANSDGRTLASVASARNAGPTDIAFIEGDGKAVPAISGLPGALIVDAANEAHVPAGVPRFVVRHPRAIHAMLARHLFTPRHMARRMDTDPAPSVHSDAVVLPGAVIGPGAAIGEGTVIGSNAVIGPGVQIGRNCSIGANASVVCALIGDHVTLLAGARVGEAGFGLMASPSGAEDAPHFGRVILQDHVTVGANSCIDRGVFEDTIVGERTKIDNLCQIAHNVILGRGVAVAAFGGISGSVRVGDGAMLGGRVGIADHVSVGEGVSLAASAGLFRDVDAGETWGGTPAKPMRQWMREVAWLHKQANPKKSR